MSSSATPDEVPTALANMGPRHDSGSTQLEPQCTLLAVLFRHRAVYHLAGLDSLPVDPWKVLNEPFAAVDADLSNWLHNAGVTGVHTDVTVTANDHVLADLDTRTALANRMLDGFFGDSPRPTHKAAIDAIRTARANELVPGVWLAIETVGDHGRVVDPGALIDEAGASVELAEAGSVVSSLGGVRALEIHHRVIGAICLAARHEVRAKPVGTAWWYVRPDGKPHFLMVFSASARGTVSSSLRPEAVQDVPRLFAASNADPRIARALAAYGQSLEPGLDPTLEFLSAFTALELLTKAQRKAPRLPEVGGARHGLAKHFEALTGGDQHDSTRFDGLYAQRNGLAHEARFNVSAADHARELFSKYMLASPLLPP